MVSLVLQIIMRLMVRVRVKGAIWGSISRKYRAVTVGGIKSHGNKILLQKQRG